MPNDAKLGLVVGVGLVIAIGVLFFRADPAPPAVADKAGPAASTASPRPQGEARGQYRPTRARTVVRSATASAQPLLHRVGEGETLSLLAERYFGERSQTALIRQANPTLPAGEGPLPMGLDVLIPEWPADEPRDE